MQRSLRSPVSALVEDRTRDNAIHGRRLARSQLDALHRCMRKLVLTSALLLLACEKPAPAAPAAVEPSQASQKVEAAPDPHAHAVDPNAPLPSGHPPLPGSAGGPGSADAPSASAPTEPPQAGGLTWEAPSPLVRRAPKSSMRVAEYGLAGEPNAELSVFYFGADQGGTVDANVTRWVGQFSQADGKETKAKRSERKVKSVDVSLVEASGVYSGGMAMPGANAAPAQSDAMLLGAIAKGPEGSVFFKLVGPKAKVEATRPAFDALVSSLRPTQSPKK
jgi:hypothetical protein